MKRYITILASLAILLIGSGLAHPCFASSNIIFILDSSGSMWGKVDNVAKITTAKKVLNALLKDLPKDANVGLMAYGHRTKEDCKDVEILSPIVPNDPDTLAKRIKTIQPKGMTPLTYSLEKALPLFASLKGQSNYIVLISDGKETCGGDPCQEAGKLAAAGVDLKIHVVGFDVSAEERKQLECIADQGNGRYFNAENTKGLEIALKEVKEEVQEKTPLATMNGQGTKWYDCPTGWVITGAYYVDDDTKSDDSVERIQCSQIKTSGNREVQCKIAKSNDLQMNGLGTKWYYCPDGYAVSGAYYNDSDDHAVEQFRCSRIVAQSRGKECDVVFHDDNKIVQMNGEGTQWNHCPEGYVVTGGSYEDDDTVSDDSVVQLRCTRVTVTCR